MSHAKDHSGYILITGASSGIGEGFARAFAREGKNLILIARRRERLEKLAHELQGVNVGNDSKGRIEIVVHDLNLKNAPLEIFEYCTERGWKIDGLVNNAGVGFQGDLVEMTQEQVESMMIVNLVSLTQLTHFFLPDMIRRKSGFILNIASTAGFQPVPHFAVYSATKSYIISFSEAIYEEAHSHGVLVSCLCPGPVHTEFQEKAHMSPRFFAKAQSVDGVVRAGMRAIRRKKALAWTSSFQRVFSFLSEFAPHSLRRRVAGKIIEATGDLKKQG